jgi:hypothetical protein
MIMMLAPGRWIMMMGGARELAEMATMAVLAAPEAPAGLDVGGAVWSKWWLLGAPRAEN